MKGITRHKTWRFFAILIGVFGLLQLFNSPIETPDYQQETDFLRVHSIATSTGELIKAACYDCHSYETKYPPYAKIFPLSIWIQWHIEQGREELNFSTWGEMPKDWQQELTDHIIKLIKKDQMPLDSYKSMHPEARWSEAQKRQVLHTLQSLLHQPN